MAPCIMEDGQQNNSHFEESKNIPEHIQSDTISHMIRQVYQATSGQMQLNIKLDHIKPISMKKMPRENQEPTFREIMQLLHALKEQMGGKDLSLIIKKLYNNFIKAKQISRQKDKKMQRLQNWQDLLQPNNVEIPSIASKQYIIRPQIREKKIIRKEDEQKYAQKQLVAKAFVTRDYGLKHLQDQVIQSRTQIVIKRQRYTDLAYGVVTEGYRLLEQFLLQQCKRNIKPSDKYQIGALHRVLCNCRLLLKPEESLTFLKFVRIAYDLESVSVTEEAAVRLYISLQKTIRSRIGNRQLDHSLQKKTWTKYKSMQKRRQFKRDEFQKFVTPEIQRQVVKVYQKCEVFAKLRAYLVNKYPLQEHLFTLESVSGIICKIVRIAIKRVFYYKEKYKDAGLPQILHLDSSYRCKIQKDGQALKIRKLLLKLWKTKQSKILQKLPLIIHQINNFIRQKDQEKANYVIAKAKPNGNVIQKLEFNINVSRAKLTQGFRSSARDQIVLKGKEKDFHHFINSQNGKKLHYYRKIQPPFNNDGENVEKVKKEEQGCKMSSSDSDSDSSDKGRLEVNDKDLQCRNGFHKKMSQGKAQDCSKEREYKTQMQIKQWLERLNLDFFKCMP